MTGLSDSVARLVRRRGPVPTGRAGARTTAARRAVVRAAMPRGGAPGGR